jgi:hypothetical protein
LKWTRRPSSTTTPSRRGLKPSRCEGRRTKDEGKRGHVG